MLWMKNIINQSATVGLVSKVVNRCNCILEGLFYLPNYLVFSDYSGANKL